jgi:integrase
MLGLAWEHLDLDKATLRIEQALSCVQQRFILREPKSKRGRRIVELLRFAVDALVDHRKRMLAEGNLGAAVVFCSRNGGFIEKTNLIRKVWQPLLERAGVPYRKFHSIRHTHVSELLARSVSVVDVARRVGDRPEVILKTYAHFIPGGGAGVARRLDEMYG